VEIVPVVIGALGTIKNGLDKNHQLLSGHLPTTELHRFTVMIIAHSIGKCWGKSVWSVVVICIYQQIATWGEEEKEVNDDSDDDDDDNDDDDDDDNNNNNNICYLLAYPHL